MKTNKELFAKWELQHTEKKEDNIGSYHVNATYSTGVITEDDFLNALEEKDNGLKDRLKQLINSSKFHHSDTTDKTKSMYHHGMTVAYEGILTLIESSTN